MTAMIGKALPRKEDLRLVTGRGRYGDDLGLPGQAYAAMVRSPHAHARIRAIDAAAARAMPGVLAVLTAEDAAADGLKPIPHQPCPPMPSDITLKNRDGSPLTITAHPILASDRVRFTGEAVAMVVADTLAQARDAAEHVAVDYDVLPAVTDTRAAAAADAPRLYDGHGNVCVDADVGDRAAAETAFAAAAHVVRLETWINRVTGVHLDLRAAIGTYDPENNRYTLYAGNGGVVRLRKEVATILDVPDDNVRVHSGDIGGNFGTRNACYPEFGLVAWAAKRVGRPVKWTADRQEAFLTDYHGRDLAVDAELALDAKGRFLGFRGSLVSNVGAHTVMFVPLIKCAELLTAVYRIPAAYVRARAVLSNTSPTSPYRSAGRPEAMFVIERLIDMACRQCGFDRVALRRKNLIPASAQPYANQLGMTYDNGDYEQAMDKSLALADWQGFRDRRRESRRNGKLRGIGLSNYIEATSGAPRERAAITVQPEGRVDVVIGTLSSGQGHETSFAQCVAEWLGVPFESITLIQGDTDVVLQGGGSHSGRSMRMAGVVMGTASDIVIARGRKIAAHLLEADLADIAFAGGRFTVKGTDRSFGLFEIAKAARERNDLADELRGPLAGESDELIKPCGYPFGAHVCEVEIEPDTGAVAVVRYAAVDDVGRAINPLILHGQSHGAIVQGVGQAMWENCHYEPASGQALAASFMDYAMPRARLLPSFATEIGETPSPTNPLGIRAGGEGGTTPALAVVVNAVVDALAGFGITHIEMPVTTERVWRAIQQAKTAAL
jgi:carbon-monoxide dehydrogenase large subunit